MEAIVKASESQTAESAQILQRILAAAADERGEWQWPLPEAQAASFEQVWRPSQQNQLARRCWLDEPHICTMQV